MLIEETTQFYDAIAPYLPEIHSKSLVAISSFYGKIRTEKAIAAAFESRSFLTISDAGRAGTVDDLWNALQEAHEQGNRALAELELAYPPEWFVDFKPER